ncbi:MAG: hypothetical protein FJ399_22295, partial [Verrucomicrobia bacterium]|nr:hypothetical protein [Verrucomicrobiota bacterium]
MNSCSLVRLLRSVAFGATATFLLATRAAPAIAAGLPEWTRHIRPDHPRLFFNADTWPQVKARATGAEQAWYRQILAQLDRIPDAPAGGHDLGIEAAQAAFVFLVAEDPRHLALAKRCLAASIDYYEACYAQRKTVNWYSTSRVHAILAWDWLYRHLGEVERREYLSRLIRVLDLVIKARPAIYRENISGYNTGFYGVKNCLWFLGCTGFGTGIETAQVN